MGYRFLIEDGKPSFTAMKDKCEAIRPLETPKNVQDCCKFCGHGQFVIYIFTRLTKTSHSNIQPYSEKSNFQME